MADQFVAPTPSFAPAPDILSAYIRGQMLPGAQMQQQQQLQTGALNIQQLQLALQNQQLLQGIGRSYADSYINSGARGATAQNGASSAAGAGSYGPSSGGIQNGPQGAVAGAGGPVSKASSSVPSSAGPVTPGVQPGFQGSDYSVPGVPQGIDPRISGAAAFLGGNTMLEGIQKNQQLQMEQRDAQIKQAQLQAEGPLNVFDAVANSPSPTRMAMNNPSIMALWPRIAQQMGRDPVKDFNDQNVARAAIFGGNQVRAAVGLGLREMPLQQNIIRGPNGQILSQNPQTNEIKQDVAPQDLKEVIGPDGQPIYQPAGKAAGMRPFNPQLYGADLLNDPAKELAYQRFIATGEMPSSGRGGAIQQAAMMNYIAQRAQADGNQGAAIAARSQAYKAQQGVVDAFTSGGAGSPAQALTSINTAVTHMAALDPLIDQLGNTASPAWNTVANAFEQQIGSTAPTSFAAIKEFVGGEVAKAVLPGGGGEAERQALLAPLNAANSTDQLKQAVQQIKVALAGKTEALRNQWDIGTNGTQGTFDKFLLPATKAALGSNSGNAPNGSNGANGSNTSNSSQFNSANDVKAAFQAGQISRAQAKQILQSQFGMQ
jgi:hypothetical protein